VASEQSAWPARLLTKDSGSAPQAGVRGRAAMRMRSIPMQDTIMMAIAFAFFALSIAYVYACDRL
jgi:hypothetical protein